MLHHYKNVRTCGSCSSRLLLRARYGLMRQAMRSTRFELANESKEATWVERRWEGDEEGV